MHIRIPTSHNIVAQLECNTENWSATVAVQAAWLERNYLLLRALIATPLRRLITLSPGIIV
ncbi:hypothetical protein T265_10718 [Opisthorchis viverrini]|uniref:Uncharacterized protein n=1 Tax=Opisthorchis viverrini TaxID=6198 RepID=A0A074Z5L0_OPIVI|nr:hypothetical protein T265_10718 [Opisthorchis viverrini]KER20817.1 hypothetical protein T265_10718 [Opisthorchis viverrini]